MTFFRYISIILILVVAVLVLPGCYSVVPPERPVAYVFPTVRPMGCLDLTEPRQVTADNILAWLEKAKCLKSLNDAGMTTDDVAILVRGIAKRGYAEIDARRTALPFRWLSISSLPGNLVLIHIGRENAEPLVFNIPQEK